MLTAIILSVSLILQIIAAIFAVRLYRITQNKTASVLLGTAVSMMALRRAISLYSLASRDFANPPPVQAEIVALLISISMLIGIALLSPLYGQLITLMHKSTHDNERKFALERLLQVVAVAANEATDPETALRTVLKEVCAFSGWPIGHVYLPAEDSSGQLWPTSIWHLEEPDRYRTFKDVTEQTRFDPGAGLPGRVFVSGKPAWIIDVNKDTNFPRAKLATDIGVKAGFGFPVLVGTEVVAILEFFSSEAEEPDDGFLEIMAHVGTQLGRVFERTQADEKIKRFSRVLDKSLNEIYLFDPETLRFIDV